MSPQLRRMFPYFAVALVGGALAWAVTFGTLPPADFTFINGTEIKSVDPARVTGAPEGRIINGIFAGLYRSLPDKDDPTLMKPYPEIAESHTLSKDRRTYTFKIRESAAWTDGQTALRPMTADDFVWSWRRFLHPETASEYSYQLHYVAGAKAFNSGELTIGSRVEIELADRPVPGQMYPSGTFLHGVLKEIVKGPEPKFEQGTDQEEQDNAIATWRLAWVFVVDVKPQDEAGKVAWDAPGTLRRFSRNPVVSTPNPKSTATSKPSAAEATPAFAGRTRQPADASADAVTACQHVLPDFGSTVKVSAPDERTLVVTLENPTPYFLDLVAFYPLYPVNRECIEKHGTPNWTKPANIVSNGPFTMDFRRIRDRIRLKRNPFYWNAEGVQINVIDALAVNSDTTNLNMYLNGQADWATTVPNAVIPELMKRPDFISEPMLTIYYYRINTTRKPLDNPLVRQALNLAINKQEICEFVTRGGQQPARSFVPPGIAGYTSAEGDAYDPEKGRKLLAEAGFPGGKGFRKITLLYNQSEAHGTIAEVIQQQWKRELGIDVELKQLEWGVFLDTVSQLNYDVARSAWIGDYPDPNTFLDMYVTGGANNQTGWSNAQYDKLIEQSAADDDPASRMKKLHAAEEILMKEVPILPVYYYVSINMVRPYVKNFYPNIQDLHPLHILKIDEAEKQQLLQKEGLE